MGCQALAGPRGLLRGRRLFAAVAAFLVAVLLALAVTVFFAVDLAAAVFFRGRAAPLRLDRFGVADAVGAEDLAQELAGVARRDPGDLLRRALGDHQATARAALRPHVHDPVGGLDHVEVVLDDDDRVALVDQVRRGPSAAC